MCYQPYRRALSVRSNMLASRFACCNVKVKIILFMWFVLRQTFYTYSMWAQCTRRSLDALRIQYNNVFRMLLELPQYCRASGIFAEGSVYSLQTILRTSGLLKTILEWMDCPIVRHCVPESPYVILNIYLIKKHCN